MKPKATVLAFLLCLCTLFQGCIGVWGPYWIRPGKLRVDEYENIWECYIYREGPLTKGPLIRYPDSERREDPIWGCYWRWMDSEGRDVGPAETPEKGAWRRRGGTSAVKPPLERNGGWVSKEYIHPKKRRTYFVWSRTNYYEEMREQMPPILLPYDPENPKGFSIPETEEKTMAMAYPLYDTGFLTGNEIVEFDLSTGEELRSIRLDREEEIVLYADETGVYTYLYPKRRLLHIAFDGTETKLQKIKLEPKQYVHGWEVFVCNNVMLIYPRGVYSCGETLDGNPVVIPLGKPAA